jgi:phosphatidylglycerol:prolipoprotein diacylglycerol transferase
MRPILFHVGRFPVHSWGLLLMLGFLLAVWRAARNARRYGLAPEDVWDASLFGLVGGVVGGRLVYILLNLSHFVAHPAEIIRIDQGGMTSFGGLIGGVLVGLLVARMRRMNVADAADLTAVSLPIGYAIGRVGCFLNGCCYGGKCDLPWAVNFPHSEQGGPTGPVHPAQLYSAFAGVVMFLLLTLLERRRRFRGQLMLAFVFLYGVYRFLVEFVREGATADLSGIAHLTQAQVASLAFSLVAAVLYALLARRASATGGAGLPPMPLPPTESPAEEAAAPAAAR